MKRLILIIAGILLLAAASALADDPGQRDSVIIDTVSADYNPAGITRTVKVWFVTDDSVMNINLPITWSSPDGLVYPGHTVWRDVFVHWADVYDTLLIPQRLLRQIAFCQLSNTDTNPPLNTGHTRLYGMDLRFVAMPNAASQFTFIDTIYDPINGSIDFGGPNGDWDLTPAFRRGFFRYGPTGIDGNTAEMPTEFALKQNYPNPFNPETNLEFAVPKAANVSIEIFNVLGQKVKNLVSEYKDAGAYTVRWNGTNENGQKVPSGVYFYRMVAGDFSQTNKMIMLR